MNILKTKIPDVIIIKPSINIDERGYFMECFKQDFFNKSQRRYIGTRCGHLRTDF